MGLRRLAIETGLSAVALVLHLLRAAIELVFMASIILFCGAVLSMIVAACRWIFWR